MSVSFGPVRDYPSWNWVGKDTVKELSNYIDVQTFKNEHVPPPTKVVVVIKQLPSKKFFDLADQNKSKVIYCPIDFFLSEGHLKNHAMLLERCSLILSHSERLLNYFNKYGKSAYIDHHGKYFLDEPSSYKEVGYVLWVGGLQYTPYLINWIRRFPIQYPLRILTDLSNGRAEAAGNSICKRLDFKLSLQNGKLNGHEALEWSENLQKRCLSEAKAAIDIKGTDFNQAHKPPTKAQKYICSGLPLAMNEGESVDYFRNRNFKIVSPRSQKEWFSKEYWENTQEMGRKLKPKLSLESIGQEFLKHINGL